MACISHLRKWVLCTFGCVFVFLEVIAWTPPRMEGRRIRMSRVERAGSPLHWFLWNPCFAFQMVFLPGPSPAPGSQSSDSQFHPAPAVVPSCVSSALAFSGVPATSSISTSLPPPLFQSARPPLQSTTDWGAKQKLLSQLWRLNIQTQGLFSL